jgi:hypothetical protein
MYVDCTPRYPCFMYVARLQWIYVTILFWSMNRCYNFILKYQCWFYFIQYMNRCYNFILKYSCWFYFMQCINRCYSFILKYPYWFYFMQGVNRCCNVWIDCNVCRLQCMNIYCNVWIDIALYPYWFYFCNVWIDVAMYVDYNVPLLILFWSIAKHVRILF